MSYKIYHFSISDLLREAPTPEDLQEVLDRIQDIPASSKIRRQWQRIVEYKIDQFANQQGIILV